MSSLCRCGEPLALFVAVDEQPETPEDDRWQAMGLSCVEMLADAVWPDVLRVRAGAVPWDAAR